MREPRRLPGSRATGGRRGCIPAWKDCEASSGSQDIQVRQHQSVGTARLCTAGLHSHIPACLSVPTASRMAQDANVEPKRQSSIWGSFANVWATAAPSSRHGREVYAHSQSHRIQREPWLKCPRVEASRRQRQDEGRRRWTNTDQASVSERRRETCWTFFSPSAFEYPSLPWSVRELTPLAVVLGS